MYCFSPQLTICSDGAVHSFSDFPTVYSLLTMPSHGVGKRCLEQIIVLASEHFNDGCKTIPLLALHIGESSDVCFGE
jgi:hypothetical protein